MPKEEIKERVGKKNSPVVAVRWGDKYRDYVGVTVDRGDKFSFHSEPSTWYTGLTVVFESEQQVDDLIKALKRAKRKTKFSE